MKNATFLSELTGDTEQLLHRLSDDPSQEVRDLRQRLSRTLGEAKDAIANANSSANEALRNYAVSVDDYVHDSPWIALGTAVAAAGVVGFLAGSLFSSNRRSWS